MIHVSIALIPALAGAVYFFGIRSLYLTALSVITCVLTEFLWQKFTRKQVTVNDFSAVVTGILLAFNMPVTVPEWVLILSAIFSILFVKQMFGGIGGNFVNPALMGRLFTMVVWPGTVMQYTAPVSLGVDAVSSATVLGAAKTGSEAGYSYLQMFLGEIPGALGETSKLLLLVGFAYMCYIGIVNIEAAFTYAATVLILTFVFTRRTVHRRYSPEPLWRRPDPGSLLHTYRLCIRIQERKDPLCGHRRNHHGGNPYIQYLSGGNLLRNSDSKLSCRHIVPAS